ncbi:hypothetical protein RJ47_12570 [Vibrio sinaloensis]|nr:hypothetical protein RJ47_12570 [Vibrio sinaloensis]
MTVINKSKMDSFVNSQRYSLFMFAVCILYTLTALPRLGISDILKNIIIFGSLPYLYFNFKSFDKKIFWIILVAILIQVTSWINSLIVVPDIAKSRPNLNPLSSIFMFVLFALWINNTKERRLLLYSSLIVSFVLTALYDNYLNGSIHLGLLGERIDYGMHNAQFTAMLATVVALLTLYIIKDISNDITSQTPKAYWALACTIILFCLFSIYATQARQVWLAFVVIAFLTPLITYKKSNYKKIALFYLTLSAFIIIFFQVPSIKERLLKESYVIDAVLSGDLTGIPILSVTFRLLSWIEASKWFIEHPILGTDFNSISYVIREAQIFKGTDLVRFGHLHSSYFEILVAYGLIGLLFYIYFYKHLINNIVNSGEKLAISLLVYFLLFWLIINFFESFNHKGLGLYAHTIVLGGLYTLQRKKET